MTHVPLYDVEVVAVVSLTYDAIADVDPFLEHRVQYLAHLFLCEQCSQGYCSVDSVTAV